MLSKYKYLDNYYRYLSAVSMPLSQQDALEELLLKLHNAEYKWVSMPLSQQDALEGC